MCAIVDSNAGFHLVGPSSTPPGRYFREWLNNRQGKLVVGGRLLSELKQNSVIKNWIASALASGIAKRVPDGLVNDLTENLQNNNVCKSDDEHVIALAIISGARLLYTFDTDLMEDFKNRQVLGGAVRGRIYTSTLKRPNLGRQHKQLLVRRDLCDP